MERENNIARIALYLGREGNIISTDMYARCKGGRPNKIMAAPRPRYTVSVRPRAPERG